jgi:ketosteroid isomerase-like protein
MKTTLCLFVFLAGTFLVAQNESQPVQEKITALEKAWNQAYKAGDAKALSALLDDSIVLVQDDGSINTKAEFLESFKAPAANEEQVAPESISVRVFGQTAIAVGVFAAKGSHKGKPYVRRERFVDTWLYKNGNWVCIASNATPMTH